MSSPSPTPTHVSLFIFLSPLPLLFPRCGCLSLSSTPVSLPIFLSPTMPSFSAVLSLSLSFSRPYLSISLEPRSLFLSLSISLSLSLSLFPSSAPISFSLYLQSLSLCRCLSFSHTCILALSLSLSLTPVFLLIFLSHTLSPFLSFLSFSIPSLSLSLFSHSYLSHVLSLSQPCLSLSFSFYNPYFSLSHSCLSFHLFALPSLSSSSLFPTHVSLFIFVSPLSLLLPLCGSISPSLFHPYLSSYLSLSHRCLIFYILFSPFLSRQSLSRQFLSLSLSPTKEREHKIIL